MGRRASALVATSAVVLAVGIALTHLPDGCPSEWAGAQRVTVDAIEPTYIRIDALHLYTVGGSVILDHSPQAGAHHPLSVIVAAGGSRENLEDVQFTCVRATHGVEVWSARPRDGGIEAAWTDGLPSGRIAVANGPEWAAGETISMEAWLRIRDQRFVIVFPELRLRTGARLITSDLWS